MSLRPSLSLRGLAAVGSACLALLSAPGAQAGVVVSIQSYSVADLPIPAIPFHTSPFGFGAGDAIPAQGFFSGARAVDNRRSRLPVAGEPVFEDVTNTSGLVSSTTAGTTVVASASLQVLPVPFLGPAVARSESSRFENHASASTMPQATFWNSQPVVIGDQTYEPEFFYLEHRRTAVAESAWFETWTAQGQGQASITLALDGHLGRSSCNGSPCLTSSPAGTDASRTDDPYVSLDARFVVFDLNTLIVCDDPDECGFTGVGHPLPLTTLTARYRGDDGLPFDFDDSWTLSFDAIAGHRYMVMGVVEVEAQNGGDIDFFNTMKITDIDVGSGVLRADVDGRDLAGLFGPDAGVVPVPATLWLVLLGGLATCGSRRRAQHG